MVLECDSTFIINGVAVHLNGMKHVFPKCKTVVSAIASDQSTIINGKAVVLAGDKATCGAIFLGNQSLVVSHTKLSNSISNVPLILKKPFQTHKLKSVADESPVLNTTMNFSGEKNSQSASVFSPDGGRVDSDKLRGVANAATFGLSEKLLSAIGVEPADSKRLEAGEEITVAAATVIGPGKIKGAAILAKEGAEIAGKTAYEIAKNGGKNSGFLKNNVERTSKELQKGIQSIQKQIEEHSSLIKNPRETMKNLGKGDWESLDPRQQKALLEKKWPSDVARQEEQKSILQGIIKERGD